MAKRNRLQGFFTHGQGHQLLDSDCITAFIMPSSQTAFMIFTRIWKALTSFGAQKGHLRHRFVTFVEPCVTMIRAEEKIPSMQDLPIQSAIVTPKAGSTVELDDIEASQRINEMRISFQLLEDPDVDSRDVSILVRLCRSHSS